MLTTLDIAADCDAIGHAVENGLVSLRPTTNHRMMEAIERCLEVEPRIAEIIATVPQAEDPTNTTEVEALEWKREMIEHQIRRAVRAAKERKAHLQSLRTDADWKAERERCGLIVDAEGHTKHQVTLATMRHWFRYWAWALDPRADYMPVQPFVPFGAYEDDTADFQWRYVAWVHLTTFVRRKSGVVEKARDMGATLGWLLWATYNWMFNDNFTALLASANEDLVDSKKDPDTLFEKVRFAIRLQPPQLLPQSFNLDKDLPYMNIANPDNGSVLSGQAPTANAGRQKRRTAVLKDESAAWPYGGFPQNTALSAVSNSNFDVSSVQGKYNQFHVTATQIGCNKFVMDWREHPWKDERWYKSLPYGYVTPIMSAETIAQEVDRDYDASQPGKVFKDWTEIYTCVEWEEVLAFYARKGFGDRFKWVDDMLMLPYDWNYCRMQDKGETAGHPRMTLYCARPGESWPLKDSVFFFIEHMAPTAADLGTVVTELIQEEHRFHIEERRPQKSLISHEAKKDRGIYLKQFKWNWQAWDTDYDSGIGNIRLWIKPIETHLPNPIRPALMGRARMYLVCEKGQASFYYDEANRKHAVIPAINNKGFARLRAEMPVYHYPPEEAGKPVKDQRPERWFDDAIACFVKDTQILTPHGERSIQDIRAGDLVCTRKGIRRVLRAEKTANSAIIHEIWLSNNRTIRGTSEHPFWTEKQEWIQLSHLRPTDELTPFQKWWSIKASSSTDTPTRNSRATGTTSSPTFTTQSAVLRRFTLKFGRTITDLCRRATTSITNRDLTTALRTSNASPTTIISASTDNCSARKKNYGEPQSEVSHESRIAESVTTVETLSPAFKFVRASAHLCAKTERGMASLCTTLSERVQSAELSSFALRDQANASALESALSATTAASRVLARFTKWFARNVTDRLLQIDPHAFVRVSVRSEPRIIGTAAVYNLEVEGEHEYFANGVLVHNCVRGVAVIWGPKPKAQTEEEKLRERLAENVRDPALRAGMDEAARDAALLSETVWLEEFKQEGKRDDGLTGIAPIVVPRSTPRRQ
jgi:hypothetical protein